MKLRAAVLVPSFLIACQPDEEGVCNGGGDASAAIGVEEVVGEFVPYDDGDTVPVVDQGAGPVLEFAYEIEGLDATQDVSVLLRIGREGVGTTDYVANADLRCAEPGPARYGATAPWPSTWPDPIDLDGTTITVDTVFTDVQSTSAEIGVDLVVDADP